MKDKKLHYGFIVAIGIFMNILVCGGIFFGASGVFIVPVTRSLGIGQGEFSMYLTIQSFTMAVVMFAAPKLIGRYSFRKLDAVSAVVASAGFAMMGLARNVFLLYAGGVLVGVGCVFLTYMISGTLLPRWFQRKLNTMIAFAMSGLGIGGIIFNPKIFPVAAVFSPWVGAVSYSLWGFVYDVTESYFIMLLIGFALSVLTALTCVLAVSSSKKLKRRLEEVSQ